MKRKEAKRKSLNFHSTVGIGERRAEQGLNPKLTDWEDTDFKGLWIGRNKRSVFAFPSAD